MRVWSKRYRLETINGSNDNRGTMLAHEEREEDNEGFNILQCLGLGVGKTSKDLSENFWQVVCKLVTNRMLINI